LFARHRDLFTDLSVVFMDTTSLSFEGEGGETLGAHGYSKDHRPDLKQMILAVVVDAEGRPICTEMMPGNTADVSVLVPVIDRLRHRFGITRACIVSGVMFLSEPGEGPSGWWDTLNSPGVAQCGMSSASVERRGHIRCSSCTMGGYLGPPYAGMF